MSLYGEYAQDYAAHTAVSLYNAAYERPAMRKRLGDVRGKRILEAACASGEYTAYLVDAGADVVALDSSQAMLDIAREQVGDRAQFLLRDLAKPLEGVRDSSFDIVLSSLTLHYVEDWSVPLSEFARVLRPGGQFLMSTHHPEMTMSAVDDYFAIARITEEWRIGGEKRSVSFYHRPLQAIVDAILDAGFRLQALVEPRLEEDASDGSPDAEHLRTRPQFLIVDAIR